MPNGRGRKRIRKRSRRTARRGPNSFRSTVRSTARTVGRHIRPILRAAARSAAGSAFQGLSALASDDSAIGAPTTIGYGRKTSYLHRQSRFKHREFVANVHSSATEWAPVTYKINPGLTLFPWLSTQAQGYEKYKWNAFRLSYIPAVGASAAGTMYISGDYDAKDLPPATKVEQLSVGGTSRGPIWRSIEWNADPRHFRAEPLMTRAHDGDVASTSTAITLYDGFSITVALEGVATGQVGELWAEYDITLLHPQIGKSISGASYYSMLPTDTNAANQHPFNGPIVDAAGNYNPTINLSAGSNPDIMRIAGASYLGFPTVGTYHVRIAVHGTSISDFEPDGAVALPPGLPTAPDEPGGLLTITMLSESHYAEVGTGGVGFYLVEVTKVLGPTSSAVMRNLAAANFAPVFDSGTLTLIEIGCWPVTDRS